MHHFSCHPGSEFASDYNKSMFFCEQEKTYITVFWDGGSYYPVEILPRESKVTNTNTKNAKA